MNVCTVRVCGMYVLVYNGVSLLQQKECPFFLSLLFDFVTSIASA